MTASQKLFFIFNSLLRLYFRKVFRKKDPLKFRGSKIITVILRAVVFFFHPDFTVGFGFTPNQPHYAGRGLALKASPPVGNCTLPRRTLPACNDSSHYRICQVLFNFHSKCNSLFRCIYTDNLYIYNIANAYRF